ncbi:MAG: FlgD immunoglobulin-like domain containing protein [Candidatus Eiseniibacteriota bacterium]
MTRSLLLAFAALTLSATLALAEPRFIIQYPAGVPQVSITGDYAGSSYAVWRQAATGGEAVRITDQTVLCMGSCYAEDRAAVPGASYDYWFEVSMPAAPGAAIRFGPYRATISPALARPVGVFVYPNPGRGPTGVQLHVAGAPGDPAVTGEAAIYDLAGRRVRSILEGPIGRGLTTLSWDGRDARGAELRPGVYLLRFTAGGSAAVARIVRR